MASSSTPPFEWRLTAKLEKPIERQLANASSSEIRQYQRELEAYLGQLSLLLQKHPFPIIGHEQFKQSVERVLDELKEHLPHRYREAIGYLPKAEFKEDLKAMGRTDGYFSVDGGGGESIAGKRYKKNPKKNSYSAFRWVFLHEVGHCVLIAKYNDKSEAEANYYANVVVKELGVK